MPNLAASSPTGLHLRHVLRCSFLSWGLWTCWTLRLECTFLSTEPPPYKHNFLHTHRLVSLSQKLLQSPPFIFPHHVTLHISFTTTTASIIIYCLLAYYPSLPNQMVSSMSQRSDVFSTLHQGLVQRKHTDTCLAWSINYLKLANEGMM